MKQKYHSFFLAPVGLMLALLVALATMGNLFYSIPVAAQSNPTEQLKLSFEERLLRDWIYQDHGLAFSDCFVNPQGNTLEKAMLEKVFNVLKPEVASPLVEKMNVLLDQQKPGNHPDWLALYQQACFLRREQRLEPVLETASVFVYAKHHVLGASHYAYTEDVTDEDYKDFSRDRRAGGQLCRLTIKPNGSVENEILYETKEGVIRDPEVSWDGTKIVFSMRTSLDADDFHLYEYDVTSKNVRQLTFGLGFADIEPVYLPNGDLLFGSTRCVQITDCWWTEVSNFYTCDADGRFLRRVTFDQVTVNYPKILPDGRVTYTRWDYNDRGQIYPQPLFVMNADGTGQTEYYGNNSWFPTTILHARGIPDSNKLIAIATGHHTYQHGKLILLDRSQGTQENQGCVLIAPERATPADRIDQYGQQGEQFQYPYALSETEYLVSYIPENRQQKDPYTVPFAIYAMDISGNRELLAWDPNTSCGQVVPLVPRPIPTVRASQVDESIATGRYYVHNVYEGPGLMGVPKGMVKSLRVVALEFRPAGIQANYNKGESGSALVSTPIAIGGGTWDVKKVLGEVPVEEDGSAFFEVPARTPVYFQMIDDKGQVIQTMRSWSTLQPGELFACIGCHEPKENTMVNFGTAATPSSLASKKEAVVPVPPYQPGKGILQQAGFSFNRDIQPIFDIYCVSCHTGGEKIDGSPAPMSLLGNEMVFDPNHNNTTNSANLGQTEAEKRLLRPSWERAGRRFSESYLNLTNFGQFDTNKYINVLDIQSAPAMLPPLTSGSVKSLLIQMFQGDRDEHHREVNLPASELKKLSLWIDLLVPYCGTYLEQNNWTPLQRAIYAYYEMKREKMEAIVSQNLRLKKEFEAGNISLPAPEMFEHFNEGGPSAKARFLEEYQKRTLPIKNMKQGEQNNYRNLAFNPDDVQGEATSYPHASSNSEFASLDCFSAHNAINGKTDNKGHGSKYPSWGPNRRTDLWWMVEFGHFVEVDQVVIWLRADFPHDSVWKSAVLEFSDGSRETITFHQTDQPQTFSFSKRKTNFIRLTEFQQESPLGWSSLTEFQAWGTSVIKR